MNANSPKSSANTEDARRDAVDARSTVALGGTRRPDTAVSIADHPQLDVGRRGEAEEASRAARQGETSGRLMGEIAHEFNNLLQVMVGYLDLIGNALRKPDVDREKLLRGVGNARAAAERATDLTRQLLALGREQRLDGSCQPTASSAPVSPDDDAGA